VLTHLARNADSHTRRLEGALRGEDIPRYPGGSEQRDREIESGSTRSAAELLADLTESAQRLEDVWHRSEQAGWPHPHLRGEDHWPTSGSPLRRLREVEVHHVDLGLGYTPTNWPDEYVTWELPRALDHLPQRLSPPDTQRLLAWLIGRADLPRALTLDPWM
jgi:maleylpyruvate isomerase